VTYEVDDADSSRSSGLDDVRLAMGTLVSPAERRSWVQASAQAAAHVPPASTLPSPSAAGSGEAALALRGNGKNEIRRAQPKWPVDPSPGSPDSSSPVDK
jgi:hypothetical protein